MLTYQRFIAGSLETNSYICYSDASKHAVIIDPAAESPEMLEFIRANKLIPKKILLTHGHIDHCGGLEFIRSRYPMEVAIHHLDQDLLHSEVNREISEAFKLPMPPKPDQLLKDEDHIDIEDISLKIVHTPGHTPGSVCFYTDSFMFAGDTLFLGSIGRTDLPGGNFEQIKRSLETLMTFPEATAVLPGHGDFTSIGQEKRINPYL